MRPEELNHKLIEMMQATKEGKIRWTVQIQTTESNEEESKPKVEEDGLTWIVDECYVSYYCKYKNQDFLLVTYEMIKKSSDKTRTSNLIFMPPLGVRFFNLHTLLPYSVEASAVLVSQCCRLNQELLDMYKVDKSSIFLEVTPGQLTIEE